jgi:hypothetical protein
VVAGIQAQTANMVDTAASDVSSTLANTTKAVTLPTLQAEPASHDESSQLPGLAAATYASATSLASGIAFEEPSTEPAIAMLTATVNRGDSDNDSEVEDANASAMLDLTADSQDGSEFEIMV